MNPEKNLDLDGANEKVIKDVLWSSGAIGEKPKEPGCLPNLTPGTLSLLHHSNLISEAMLASGIPTSPPTQILETAGQDEMVEEVFISDGEENDLEVRSLNKKDEAEENMQETEIARGRAKVYSPEYVITPSPRRNPRIYSPSSPVYSPLSPPRTNLPFSPITPVQASAGPRTPGKRSTSPSSPRRVRRKLFNPFTLETNMDSNNFCPIGVMRTEMEAVFDLAADGAPVIKTSSRFYPTINKIAKEVIKKSKVGRRLDVGSCFINFNSGPMSQALLHNNSSGLLNGNAEIIAGQLFYYLYRNSYTSLGLYRITAVQAHPSDIQPRLSCKNVVQVREHERRRCPLADVILAEPRRNYVQRLHTANLKCRYYQLGEGRKSFAFFGFDNAGNGSWSNLGNSMTHSERSAASRCHIHANSLRPAASADGLNSLLGITGNVSDLLLWDPSSIQFQSQVYTSEKFNTAVETFLCAYHPQEIKKKLREIYVDAPEAYLQTAQDSTTVNLVDLVANSTFNTVVLSIPGETFVELKAADFATMVAKAVIRNGTFFTETVQ